MSITDTEGARVARLRAQLDRERRARETAERVAERTTQELSERQRELALLVAATRAANDSRDVEDALSRAIRSICEYTGWPVGHVYLADPELGLRPTTVWHAEPPERFEAFRRITAATPLAPGVGLGGRVLVSREPLWLPDVTVDPNFVRAQTSVDIGVRGAFGFPMLVGAEIVGVMEFFSESVQPPKQRLLELMVQIGTELGRAVERDRARVAELLLHRELTARAVELERSNAELEQFASVASHDLQEPLRKVRTFTARVLGTESERLSERGQDYLRRADASATRMQALIEDLLTFSRVATGGHAFGSVDLAQVTTDVLADLEAAVEGSGATVHVGALPTLDADAPQMRQLLQNLLANALKFRRADTPPQVSIDSRRDGEVVEITVRDNGIGFEPRNRERIFRVFERLHGRSEYEGTGIGLALCRKIAERHGGTVRAEGEPGVGATFTVTLRADPRAGDDPPAAPA